MICVGVICLLAVLVLQMVLTAQRNSITWDEDDHLYAGYMSLKHGDFGINPEHPPFVKMLSAAPLLGMQLNVPVPQDRYFKHEGFLGGKDFVFKNDANTLLFRARLASSILSILLAIIVFLGTREMFGTGPAFIALTLLVFDPNIVGHSALVTTDIAVSLFLFSSIYAFYRYVKAPSIWKLVLVGVAAGMGLASKHTGILLFPVLVMLAAIEVVKAGKRSADSATLVTRKQQAVKMLVALVVISVISVSILWAFYGFRYAARPAGMQLNPTLDGFMHGLAKPSEAKLLTFVARHHLLPESYIYGLVDVRSMADFYQSFVFGKVYPHGVWFYFPVSFAVKSTLGFLILLVLACVAIGTRRLANWREILYLTIPPVFYLLVAMNSKMNIGVRHILPLYVFFGVLIGGAAWALIRQNRRWAYAVTALVVFHAVSALSSFPAYVAYGNELFGGSASTYKHLSDSNSDWGQQLKATKRYLDKRGIKDCYFVYFAGGVVDTDYYGIPCKLLPTPDSMWVNAQFAAPEKIDGTILISAGDLSGFEFGPGTLNPYEQFKSVKPTAVIDYGLFVFDGHFEIPRAAATWHNQRAGNLMDEKKPQEALVEAQKAVALAPDMVNVNNTLGDVLTALGRQAEARPYYEKALMLAKTVEPEFQMGWIPGLQQKLAVPVQSGN
jgi:hypothetical protein